MSRKQQFTFVDVSAQKHSNKKIIKSHVANDVNRKKRQDAVKSYQESLRSQENSEHTSGLPSPSIIVWPDSERTISLHDPRSLQTDSSHVPQDFPITIQSGPLYDCWRLFCATLGQRKGPVYPILQARSRPSLSRGHSSQSSIELSHVSSSLFAVPWLLHQQKAACIPRISSPTELRQFELSLNFVNAFLLGKNESTWSHQIDLNPYHYDHDYQVGVWREAFCLGFDHLQEGRCEEAFKLLNVCLGSTTNFLQKQHPNMLYVLLEIMYEAHKLHDQNLSIIIQNNLTQMTAAVLGPVHPLTLLMKHLREADPNDSQIRVRIELLIQAVVDMIQFLFGPNRFQSTGIQFGTLRRLLNDKQIDQASNIVSKVEQCWTEGFPPDALPLRYLEIDKAKVSIAKLGQDKSETDWTSDDMNVITAAAAITTTTKNRSNSGIDDNTRQFSTTHEDLQRKLDESVDSIIQGLEALALMSLSSSKQNSSNSTPDTNTINSTEGNDIIMSTQNSSTNISDDGSAQGPNTDLSLLSSSSPILLPPELEPLGRELVLGSYHALSLHMYIHIDEIFANRQQQQQLIEDENVCFSTRIARLLVQPP